MYEMISLGLTVTFKAALSSLKYRVGNNSIFTDYYFNSTNSSSAYIALGRGSFNPNPPAISFSVTFPTTNFQLEIGKIYDISYVGGDNVDKYSVYLISGPLGTNGSTLLGTTNQKTLSWTIPSTVNVGNGYKISFSGKYASGVDSPAFNIVGKPSELKTKASSNVASPLIQLLELLKKAGLLKI